MTVQVEVRADASADARAAAGRELAHLIKSNVGVTVTCEVGDPGTLARSEGKARRVIDQR
jgi:phenylacetate-CoA ligase